VRTKKTADLAARLIRTIDRIPPSAECCVTASGYCLNNCKHAANDAASSGP
jgi:hypothetical protein